ncbi:hypothetical protein [Enterobacter wuhouensis]|uniref:hypothetical protein n=1 Tax=Enterobacter wuhouensis TaxID=2529381 RepID=UPI003D778AD5
MSTKDFSISWPAEDVFFNNGILYILENIEEVTHTNDFLFVNLCGYNLRQFMLDFPLFKKNLILITSKRLRPLADFLMDNHAKVIYVFDNNESITSVLDQLITTKKTLRITRQHLLNYREYDLLSQYLHSGSTEKTQEKYFRSYSTVQAWKNSLAHKFNLRRLMDITLRD